MGNQVAIRTLTQPGQEVIAESRAHILDYEMATTAVFSGCLIRAVQAEGGILELEAHRAGHQPLWRVPRGDRPHRD